MDEFKIEFIKEAVNFASEWYKKTVKEYVAKYPEVILNMSEEKIVKMKAKVSELAGEAEKIVKDELDNPELWWHQKPNLHDSIDQYTQISDKYPEILDRALRHALGRLGIVLAEFGFHVTVSRNTGSYYEFWFEHHKPPTKQSRSIPIFLNGRKKCRIQSKNTTFNSNLQSLYSTKYKNSKSKRKN